jgi:hypothetical protein
MLMVTVFPFTSPPVSTNVAMDIRRMAITKTTIAMRIGALKNCPLDLRFGC